MKKLTIIIILFINIFTGFSQNFSSLVDEISENLQNVASGKKEYQQHISLISPGVVSLSITQVDSKGNSHSTSYEFNLADIDKNTVKAKTKKDLITIQVTANKKQKLIKKTVDEEKTSYIPYFQFYATDIENGRELAKMIKNVIPVAKKIIDKRLSLNGYNDRLKWLKQQIDEVPLINKQFSQTIEKNDIYPGSLIFHKVMHAGKTEKDNTYLFNLSTLNPKQINFEIKGDVFGVKVVTKRNLKVVKVLENDTPKSFTSSFTIVCKNIEQARDIQKVFADIIPLAKEKFEKSMPKINNLEDGYETINSIVNVVEDGTNKHQQEFKGDCVLRFTVNTETAKKQISDEFNFNWVDINKNQLKIKNKSKLLALEVKTTGGNKYIKHLKEEVLNNYTNTFNIYIGTIEEALILQKTLEKMIDICVEKDKKDSNANLSFDQAIEILFEKVKGFEAGETTYEQAIELQENNKTIHFTKTVVSGKSAKEYVYEVNLKDLNPKSVNIKVSGKKVSVEVKTNHQEKIIQFYKDEKIQAYQNKFEIMAPDIETARKIKKAVMRILTK